jgi:hypothetical protein
VGDAAGDFFPGTLLLGAEEFGGVFEDEDVAEMLAAGVRRRGSSSRATVASSKATVAARCRMPALDCISISAEAEPMRWRGGGGGRGRRRCRRGRRSRGRPMNWLLAAGVEHLGEGAVGEDDVAIGGERDDAVGDGFDDGFELGAAGFEEGVVEVGELGGGALGGGVGAFEVGGHGVEAVDEFAELFGGGLSPTRWA